MNSPTHVLVLCVDEKSQIQALDRRQPISQRKIKRGAHRSGIAIERDIRAFPENHNEDLKPFIWTKSADVILRSIERFRVSTLDAHGVASN